MNATPRSKVFVGHTLPKGSVPVLRVFGDPDDHLRLSVLIAESLRTRVAQVEEEATACLEKTRMSWGERLGRTCELVARARTYAADELFVLHDLDGLAPDGVDPARAWDDRDFVRERSEFFQAVLHLIEAGGWVVVRPQPTGPVTLALEDLIEPDAEEMAPFSASAISTLGPVSPDCHRVLRWALESRALSEDGLNDLIQETLRGSDNDLERHLLRIVYDNLKPAVQREAQRLTPLRGVAQLNGRVGPYPVAASSGPHQVSRQALDTLLSCGFLQQESPSTARMPRIVRTMLHARAGAEDPDAIREEHAWLAELSANEDSTGTIVEVHYHAVLGVKTELALKTARYYGTALRELAFRLSERGDFKVAASVYRQILDGFDADDAYACEYYAYNLARLDAVANRDLIREHYRRASELDRQNPLFHGRWLGFRGQFGEDIENEFDLAMRHYLQSYGGHSAAAVDRFASEVLKALARGNQVATKKRIIDRWYSQLTRIRNLAVFIR